MSEIINNFKVFRDFPPNLTENIKIFYVSSDYDNYYGLLKSCTFGYCVLNENKVFGLGEEIHKVLGYNVCNEKYALISELCQKNIQEFYQGFDYMFARNEKNEIFSWGINKYGQLGRGYQSKWDEYLIPQKVDFFDGKNIIEISCGLEHCLALSSDGLVYGWGNNFDNKVGCGKRKYIYIKTPKEIDLKEKIQLIHCKGHNSYAISFEGNIYYWGLSSLLKKINYHPILLNEPDKITSILKTTKSWTQLHVLSYNGIIYEFCENNFEKVFDLNELIGELNGKKINDLFIADKVVICETEDCVYNLQISSFVKTSYKTSFEYLLFEFQKTFKTIHLNENKLFVLNLEERCDVSEPLIQTFK